MVDATAKQENWKSGQSGSVAILPDIEGSTAKQENLTSDQSVSVAILPIRECILYFIFLIGFTVMCVNGRTYYTHNYWISHQFRYTLEEGTYTDILDQNRFFREISDISDVQLYVEQVLMPMIYINKSASGKPLEPDQWNFVLGQNKLLGGMRITIVRVKEEACGFKGLISSFLPCFPKYSRVRVNNSNYTIGSLVMKYMDAHEAQSTDFHARLNRDGYGGDGNVYDLGPEQGEAYADINELFVNGFIGRDARVVFFDFVTLNPNLDLHTIVRLCFEIPAEGGVSTYSEIKTVRFWRYLGTQGTWLLGSEIFVALMVLFYTQEELIELYKDGFVKYKLEAWNYVDWVNLLFFYVTIFWRIKVELGVKPTFTNIEYYESYRLYLRNFSMESYFNVVNGFILYFKLFKYLNVSRRIRLLFTLFRKTACDMLVFLIILFVIWLAFGISGFLSFSSDVSDYRSMKYAILNLFRYTVSDMDYASLSQSSFLFGTLYYVTWTVLMILILVNVFIAILSDGYAAVQDENRKLNEKIHFGGFFLNKIQSFLFGAVDENKDGQLSKEELQRNFGKQVTSRLIMKFDKDGDGRISKDEARDLWNSLESDPTIVSPSRTKQIRRISL